MQIVYLDISNKGVYPCIQAKQMEVGRKFLAVITDNSLPYEIPGNALLSVWYSGDNGNGNYSAIGEQSAFRIYDNKIEVELAPQMLTNPGEGSFCLTVLGGDGKEISSWNIPYCVEKKPGMGRHIPEDYYTALTEAGVVAVNAATTAQNAAKQAQNAADSVGNVVEETRESVEKSTRLSNEAKAESKQATEVATEAKNIVAIIETTKQNKLSWVTEQDIESMIAGTYEGVEDETPSEPYAPRNYQITDTATGEIHSLYVDGGNLKMEVL